MKSISTRFFFIASRLFSRTTMLLVTFSMLVMVVGASAVLLYITVWRPLFSGQVMPPGVSDKIPSLDQGSLQMILNEKAKRTEASPLPFAQFDPLFSAPPR